MPEVVHSGAGEVMADTEAEAKRLRLQRFVGARDDHDREVVEHWRQASPAEHASAMIELSNYATEMAAQTGHGKSFSDRFPGFPEPPLHAADRTEGN